MSSLRRDKWGTYFLDIRIDGKRRRVSLDTKDRKLASIKAKQTALQLNDNPQLDHLTIDEFARQFLIWAAPPRRSAGTLQNYRSVLNSFRAAIGFNNFDRLNFSDANNYITSLAARQSRNAKRPITARGVNFHLRALRSIFNIAKAWNLISENPFTRVQKMPEKQLRPRALRREEVHAFFEQLQKEFPGYFPLFIFYLFTGMRRTEALTLSWESILWDENSIVVHGKRGKYRIVPMMPAVRKILESRRQLPQPFSYSGSHITHVFVKVRKAAGIEGIKLHDLRKSFGTLLADYGISEFFIQQWLGHSDGQITRMHYIGSHDQQTLKKLAAFEQDLIGQSMPNLSPERRKAETQPLPKSQPT